MRGIIDLSVTQVILSYIFVVIVLFILKKRGIKREKEMLISSFRMTFQLILTGYVLVYIFKNPNPFITVALIFIMECFAVYTVFQKFKGKLTSKLKQVIAMSMVIGTISCLTYFLMIVIRIYPWYDPQYFIPIAGMMIGNSMTGISLAVKSLLEGMTLQKNVVEEAMILGASPKMATRGIINKTFDAAIMPTINSMLGMGIIFLPGMMTGQILSGTSPATAVNYQIAIMLGILGAVSLTVILLLHFGYRSFFNEEDQLIQ
ncbi:MAG: iron export ABC transporter permease subunit FetB [Anaerovorax sp.]|nr:iron export ABC transporter permease subunit FetB [Anaerovorax sp.]